MIRLQGIKESERMKQSQAYVKEYVEVGVEFLPDGAMQPRFLIWSDGRRYDIDKIKAVQAAPALKAGGQGDRYTIMIEGHERYLFFEHNADYGNERIGRWFVEKRLAPST